MQYGGVPILARDDYCTDCILDEARGLVCADSYRDRRMLMREIAEAALAGKRPDGKLYYVSKTWYVTINLCIISLVDVLNHMHKHKFRLFSSMHCVCALPPCYLRIL